MLTHPAHIFFAVVSHTLLPDCIMSITTTRAQNNPPPTPSRQRTRGASRIFTHWHNCATRQRKARLPRTTLALIAAARFCVPPPARHPSAVPPCTHTHTHTHAHAHTHTNRRIILSPHPTHISVGEDSRNRQRLSPWSPRHTRFPEDTFLLWRTSSHRRYPDRRRSAASARCRSRPSSAGR